MIRLLLIALLIVGCGSGVSTDIQELIEPEIPFVQIFPETTISRNPNGTIEVNGDEVTYTSHNIDYAYPRDCEKWYCKKVEYIFENTSWTQGRETKHVYGLKINECNKETEWIIVTQDWAKVDETDPTGNHPTTTLKIECDENGLTLTHYENSWQYLYTTSNPIDPDDPQDRNHNHDPNLNRGSIAIDLNQYYHIEFTIKDGDTPTTGGASLKVNGQLISNANYQTKQTKNRHFTAYGMYWNKFYNTEYNLSNSITIKDFKVLERYN